MLTQDRAEIIWDQRGIQNTIPDSAFLPGEREEVMERWKKLPGNRCFMDAFFTFLYPETPTVIYTDPELRAAICNEHLQRNQLSA